MPPPLLVARIAARSSATQQEIADAVDVPQQTVDDWLSGFTENSAAEESVKWSGFEPPIYNVWKQQKCRQHPRIPLRGHQLANALCARARGGEGKAKAFPWTAEKR